MAATPSGLRNRWPRARVNTDQRPGRSQLGLIMLKNLRVAGGYNVFGFTDQDFTSLGYTQRRPYLDVGFKFDETLFGEPKSGPK